MNNFADYWWLWLVALAVVLLIVWLLRPRRRSDSDQRPYDPVAGAPEELGAAPSTGAVGLRAEPEGMAAEAIVEEARTPEAISETEAALKRAATVAEPTHAPESQPAPAAATAPEPAPTPAAPASDSDNLQLLKGVGPKLAAKLNELGVTSFAQIAGWSAADIAEIDSHLGTFKGRATRDNWVDQAGYLARGDKAGFEAKYGALGA